MLRVGPRDPLVLRHLTLYIHVVAATAATPLVRTKVSLPLRLYVIQHHGHGSPDILNNIFSNIPVASLGH